MIGIDEVFVATIAFGAAASASRRTATFSSRSSGSDSTSTSAASAASARSAPVETRSAACRTSSGRVSSALEQPEARVHTLLRAAEIAREQTHLVASKRVLAANLGSHRALHR